MKATYRVQGLSEVSSPLSFIQAKPKEELLEALGFCDPHPATHLRGQQEETRTGANKSSLTSIDSRPLIREQCSTK
jgi:hypothetical protein